MRYCELGEAKILKRYAREGLLAPAKSRVAQASKPENWRTFEEVASGLLQDIKPKCAAAS